MYKFGKKSKERLLSCHEDLQLIMNTAIEVSNIDFAIVEGYRTLEKQMKYFIEGKSKIDGITKKGKHNYNPSLACDICAYVNRKANWDKEHLSYLAGLIHGVSETLHKENKIIHRVRWGGNFNMNGELLEQSFDDRPHYELVN